MAVHETKELLEDKKIAEYDVVRVIVTMLVIVGHCTYYKLGAPNGGCDYTALTHSGLSKFYIMVEKLLVVKKGHIEESRYLCVKKEQRCTAVKSWRSSTSITRPNGCREGCQSRHTVHGTTFRTRYLTDGSGTYTGEWFRWRLQGYRKDRRKKERRGLSRGRRIRAERKSASGSISSRVQG